MSSPIKVLITGPEATGKSTLSEFLADHYKTTWVAEYAREYLQKLDRKYNQSDLVKILEGQMLRQSLVDSSNHYPIVFFDTGPEVIFVWSDHKYQSVDRDIVEAYNNTKYDLILLMDVDLPWVDDPLRESPDYYERRKLFIQYLAMLNANETPLHVIRGQHDERNTAALEVVNNFIENNK